MGSRVRYLVQRLGRTVRKHVLNDVRRGNLRKPWHFATTLLKRRMFGYPYLLEVEPSNVCNIRCPLCPSPGHLITRHKQFMSYEDFMAIVENVGGVVHNIYITGTGEPLLNKDIWRMVRYAADRNLSVSISTNATLFTDEWIDEMFISGLDHLIFSCDGVSRKSYARFRVGGDFDKVRWSMERICARRREFGVDKPFLEWQFILNCYNEDEIELARALSNQWGIDRFHVKSLSLNEHLYDDEKLRELAEEYLPRLGHMPNKMRYTWRDNVLQPKPRERTCALPMQSPAILVDGSVSICCMDINGQYTIGNALEQSFVELWHSPAYREMRDRAHVRKLPICTRCPSF